MKIAIPHWQSRISPVCDEARHFLVVCISDNQEVSRRELEVTFPGTDLVGRAAQLLDADVSMVICGAISQALETMLLGVGIQVIPQVCGNVEDVLQAFRTGVLEQERFTLPGCARRRRLRRRDGQCRRDVHFRDELKERGKRLMILAIPLEGDRFCEHFGRADQFVMFEIDEGLRTFTELKRVAAPPHEPGVLPRWLAEQGAQVVIAGGMGPRAQQMLAEQGVRVVLGAASQTPEELTRAFLNEELAGGANSCDHSQHICGH